MLKPINDFQHVLGEINDVASKKMFPTSHELF